MSSVKDVYYKWFQENCKSVDFRTFSGVKAQVLKYLKDPKCPPETKILFGTFLLKTIYMMYKFRGPDKTDLVECLLKPIEACKNVISKGEYLKYHDVEAMSLIALHFYLNRFKDRDSFFILQLLNDTQLIKGYLQRSDINDEELLEHFLSWVERAPVDEQRSNILDVLLRYYPKDQRVITLHRKMQFGDDNRNDVYNDAQNVHDEEINAAVLNAAENLMDWGEEHPLNLPPSPFGNPVADWARGVLFSHFTDPKQQQIIECCIQRCTIDTTCFGSGFNIADIFYTTLHYITLSPHAEGIYPIFMEEMDNMKELCSSGYVARCITALQGQHKNGDFDIVIPFSKKLHALVSMKISSEMERANEYVVLGTYDPDYRKYFLDFVCSVVNSYLPSAIESNGLSDVAENIIDVLFKITESEWTFDADSKKVTYAPIFVAEESVKTSVPESETPESVAVAVEKADEKVEEKIE